MNQENLIADGYKILNAKIKSANLSMAAHNCFTLNMVLDGAGWSCCYGGCVLGHGYLGAKKFEGSEKGLEYIMRIMDIVGVERFNDLPGKYVRVATNGFGSTVKIIGNIISDKWFDQETFFNKE